MALRWWLLQSIVVIVVIVVVVVVVVNVVVFARTETMNFTVNYCGGNNKRVVFTVIISSKQG
jgi:hypothetical protein